MDASDSMRGPQRAPRRVLILAGAAGEGHLAAARAVRDALERAGAEATIHDGLAEMGPWLNWLHVRFYAWQIARVPWTFGIAFRILGVAPVTRVVRALIGVTYGRRLARIIAAERPDAVVSTIPTVTAGLGRLRRAGRLPLPVIAVVTDYGAHPLWMSPDIDLHLVPCRATADLVLRLGGRAAVMRFPVGERFRAPSSRAAARAALALPAGAFVPLIVGGGWGVGALEEATACAVRAGAVPVVVAGRNAELRARLDERFGKTDARIHGWTDEMPALMAAADCLVQHAGGVTCLEAMAIRLPIVFYRPTAGHGRFNARVMRDTGSARIAGDARELAALFRGVAAGTITLPAPVQEPGRDVAEAIAATGVHAVAARAGRLEWAYQPAVGLAAALGIAAFVVEAVRADAHAAARGEAAVALPVLALWTLVLLGIAASLFSTSVGGRWLRRRTEAADGATEALDRSFWIAQLLAAACVMALMEWRYPVL